MALKSIKQTNNRHIKLHIVGGSLEEEEPFKEEARKLGIEHQCVWHEKVSHDQVNDLMRSNDVFFFTSIAEGTPHVILEALSNSLPIVCFDTCGHGDCVDNTVGYKIPLSNPRDSISRFAEILNKLYADREELKVLSDNCYAKTQGLTWDCKALQMVDLYKQAIDKETRNRN